MFRNLKVLQIILVAAVFVASFICTAEAKNNPIQIQNDTGYTIKNLYFAPKGSSFGNDRIADAGISALNDGETLSLLYDDSYSEYSLKIVFNNGAARVWNKNSSFDVSGAYKITIVSNGTNSRGIEVFSIRVN